MLWKVFVFAFKYCPDKSIAIVLGNFLVFVFMIKYYALYLTQSLMFSFSVRGGGGGGGG